MTLQCFKCLFELPLVVTGVGDTDAIGVFVSLFSGAGATHEFAAKGKACIVHRSIDSLFKKGKKKVLLEEWRKDPLLTFLLNAKFYIERVCSCVH